MCITSSKRLNGNNMPLVLEKNIDSRATLYLWEYTESLEELLDKARLSREEEQRFNTFHSERRKKEWTAIRALLNSIYDKKVVVTYEAIGKPRIDCAQHISLSHTDGLVMLIVSDDSVVGADCEHITDRVLRIKERFLNPREIFSIKKDSELLQVLVYWCLKEVLFKISPLAEIDFRKDIEINAFDSLPENTLNGIIRHKDGQSKADLGYFIYKNTLVTWGIEIC